MKGNCPKQPHGLHTIGVFICQDRRKNFEVMHHSHRVVCASKKNKTMSAVGKHSEKKAQAASVSDECSACFCCHHSPKSGTNLLTAKNYTHLSC
jgi:hypothetical protein